MFLQKLFITATALLSVTGLLFIGCGFESRPDPNINPAYDPDGDSLSTEDEIRIGTDPYKANSFDPGNPELYDPQSPGWLAEHPEAVLALGLGLQYLSQRFGYIGTDGGSGVTPCTTGFTGDEFVVQGQAASFKLTGECEDSTLTFELKDLEIKTDYVQQTPLPAYTFLRLDFKNKASTFPVQIDGLSVEKANPAIKIKKGQVRRKASKDLPAIDAPIENFPIAPKYFRGKSEPIDFEVMYVLESRQVVRNNSDIPLDAQTHPVRFIALDPVELPTRKDNPTCWQQAGKTVHRNTTPLEAYAGTWKPIACQAPVPGY